MLAAQLAYSKSHLTAELKEALEVNDHIRQAAGRLLHELVEEPVRQVVRDRDDDMYRRGFTRAAGISLRHIQEKLDFYKEQMTGQGLNKAEQMVYTQLDELKAELEADFDRYWQSSGVDWRPPKPIAKGVIRQRGKSE